MCFLFKRPHVNSRIQSELPVPPPEAPHAFKPPVNFYGPSSPWTTPQIRVFWPGGPALTVAGAFEVVTRGPRSFLLLNPSRPGGRVGNIWGNALLSRQQLKSDFTAAKQLTGSDS